MIAVFPRGVGVEAAHPSQRGGHHVGEQAPEDGEVERGGMDEESGVPVTGTETPNKREDRDSDM